MANKELRTKIVLRNDTPENWRNTNPALLKGELGVEVSATGDVKLKVGKDGVATWNDLPYFGDVSAAQVFFANIAYGADKVAALKAVATNPAVGDIGIVRMPIYEGSDKIEHTAYVFDGANWAAMDGNYHAENVYFNEDLTYTADIGALTLGDKTFDVLSAKGKSLEEVLKTILAQRIAPEAKAPTAKITSSNIGAKEVGTKVSIQYALQLTQGSYTYGPNSQVNETAYSATFNNQTLTTKTGTFNEIQVTDNTNLNITGNISYSDDTVVPVDNLGAEYADAQIKAGTANAPAKGTLSGYRNWFMYIGTDWTTVADSAFIRGNATAQGSGKNAATKKEVSIPAGTNRVIIAIPAGTGYSKKLTDVIDVDGMGLSQFSKFTESNVDVEGANGYTAMSYKVWDMKTEKEAGIAATRYNFVIG